MSKTTNEIKEQYEKQFAINEILVGLETDYDQPAYISDLASTIRNSCFDITDQESIDLFVKLDPKTGKFNPLGIEAIKEITKENVIAFLNQYHEHVLKASKEDPIYDFQYTGSHENACRKLFPGGNVTQTIQYAFDDETKAENKAFKDFAQQHEELINTNGENYKDYYSILRESKKAHTTLDVLREANKAEKSEKDCMEVAAGRSNKMLGRHENYSKLKSTPLDKHEGIPMEGLALLVANSHSINRNTRDGSTQQTQKFTPDKELSQEDQQFMKEIELNQESMNVGAKVLDSFFNGSDISRMGNRAGSIVDSRIALNDAMNKYLAGDKKPLADLMADSLDVVYSQALYTSENLSKVGTAAMAEICKACTDMFEKDPELKQLTGYSQEKLDVLKGVSKAYAQIQNPRNKMLQAYNYDKGPGTKERKEALNEVLFSQYLESTLVMDISRNIKASNLIAKELIDDDRYNEIINSFPEDDRDDVRQAITNKLAADNIKVPIAFNMLGKGKISIASMKKNFISRVEKSDEYKKYLGMPKEQLYKEDFKVFTDALAKRQFENMDKKQKALDDAKELEANKAYFDKAMKLHNDWDSIAKDLRLPEAIATLAAQFKNTKLDITNQDQLDLLCFRNMETGTYETAGFKAAENADRESMIAFLNNLYERIGNKENALYDFNHLATQSDGIQCIRKKENGSVGCEKKGMKNRKPDEPIAVASPNVFKRVTNTLFGWFKNDTNAYRKYERDYAEYEKELADIPVDEQAKQRFVKKHKAVIDSGKKYLDYHTARVKEALKNKTVEQKLRERVTKEQQRNKSVELASGRSNELLSRHKNYETLTTLPLDDIYGMPMSGLALLVANSVSINRNIEDASTQPITNSKPSTSLTKDESEFLKCISDHTDKSNVSAKIMQSFYQGKDVSRMGDRAAAIIESRKRLNDAAAKYLEGDEQPLADLINDSIDVVYFTVHSTANLMDSAQGKAVVEIYHALDKLFKQDPEFRKQINISDERLNEIKGKAAVCELLVDPEQQVLNAYQKDEGPGSLSRERVLDDILFRRFLHASIKQELTVNQKEASTLEAQASNSKNAKDFFAKFKNPFNVKVCASDYWTDTYLKESELTKQFAKDDFNLDKFKSDTLDIIHMNPTYLQLLNMEKTELYTKDFDELAEKIYEDNAKQLQAAKQKENLVKEDLTAEKVAEPEMSMH